MKITFENKIIEVEEGTRIKDALQNEIEQSKTEIIACNCNNNIRSLNYKLREDSVIKLIDYSDADGQRIYIRGLLYIMAKAFNELYPEIQLSVNYQLSNSMFCELEGEKTTAEMIKKVSERMQEIVKKDLRIRKVVMTSEEAEEFYKREKTIKGKLQTDLKQKNDVSLYYCEDYYNYFFGVMPISTKYMKYFKIEKYLDGFIVRYPSKSNPNEIGEFINESYLATMINEYDDIYKLLDIHTIHRLNKQAKLDEAKRSILLAEALHEKKIAKIADSITKNKEVKMVLIAGPSSSGKTTFAKRLGIQLQLNGFKPKTISVDNYFVEREDNPVDENGKHDFECIEAIDLELFNKHLKQLLNGEEIEMPEFDFKVGTKRYNGNMMKLAEDEILIIEGIHCLNDKLTAQIPKEKKYKVYISGLTVLNVDYYNRISTTDTRLIRRIVRDHQFRGYSALHTIRMWDSVSRGEKKNIYPFQAEADSMFNSALVYELAALKPYAVPLLEEIDESYPEHTVAQRLLILLKYFETIKTDNIPPNSILREFVGGSIFEE